jgi:class 3 adenylate cyclase/alpha-beta hydrolase superfamily lysophospholipase
MKPEVKYARNGDVHIAYETFGEGPIDVVIVPGFVSHLDVGWENPGYRKFADGLGRFARVIAFDKRGTGMSDPVEGVPTLEQRMDDVRIVMDAAGSEKAALAGFSEGAPMCVLFGATYPERTRALVLCGGMARSTWAPDYPWASTPQALEESTTEFLLPAWGSGENLEPFAPSVADDPGLREWWGKMERVGASPGMMLKLYQMFLEIDVREVLPMVQVPTLVLHHTGDRVVNVNAGRYLGEHIPGAKYVELPGRDHAAWAGDVDGLLGEIEEFLTGARAAPPDDTDRVLATVLFTDVVGSTVRAVEMGDKAWRDLLERHHAVVRGELAKHRGREVKTMGDGFLATFDGPARGVRAAQAIVAGVRNIGLEVRSGLHTGECEMLGEDVGGIAVHIGARIAARADAGEVLVSSTVKDLVAGSGIEFDDRGSHELKGVPGEWHLFAAQG